MATIRERLDSDLKAAMRSRDEVALTTIRSIKSAVKYKEVEDTAKVLDDEEIGAVVATLVKQHRDSIFEFTKAQRLDLAAKEQAELELLLAYLPAQLTHEELIASVAAGISEVSATSVKDLGKVMKLLNGRLKGRVEGKALSEEAKRQLAGG